MRMRLALILMTLLTALLCGCMSRTERLFQRAEMFLSQGQPELAAAEYYRLATRYPRSSFAPNALYKLAYLFREEFDSPEKAIQTYRLLGERYPDSSYADESWLWVLQIQGGKLKDMAGMRATRDIIRQRFADDERVCASAQLELARALLAAGQLDVAESEARAVSTSYPRQERQCAAAMLIVARVLEKRGGKQSDQAVRAYEQIVNRYPNTPSAVEAKRSIGWLYYGLHGEQVKAAHQAKVRAARVIGNIPPVTSQTNPRLKPLACLSSLLGARGVSVGPEALLVVSGAAFDFWFDPDRPAAPRLRLPRNALSDVAEEYGFSVNISAVPSAEASFAGLAGAIAAGRPAMVPIGDGGDWWVVSGYKPAEDVVYALRPGQSAAQAMARKDFVGRWARSGAGHVRCVTGPYFQLSLGTRATPPEASAVLKTMARRAAEHRAGVASGYAALTDTLGSRAPEADEAQRRQLRDWADRRLPEIMAERLAIAGFLRSEAKAVPDAREALESAAQEYGNVAALGRQLREMLVALTAPAQGAEPPAEQTWPEAVTLVRQMQEAEERGLQQVAALGR
ncbi:MAG: tetratricopeptide repeat protein [Armatimonadetes bacterium]|nr:tetratricopeptide repeat protein [Armatimonadota bacterium]